MKPRWIIGKPCHKTWHELKGEGRERFCQDCQSPVYAKELYSDEEWTQLWTNCGEHACALISGDSAPVPRSRRAILAGALLTAISPLMAQDGRIRVRLIDPIVFAGLEVSVSGKDPKNTKTLKTDRSGEALFTGLSIGIQTVHVTTPEGFYMRDVQVNVSGSAEVLVAPKLELGTVGETVPVKQPEPIFDTPLPEKKYPTLPR